ncbi:MAG TPA: uracil-DNA glycosylase [Chromatiaceae bacterium]|nr:uracil-DNA glycosylase [Chromatiaceae bacterium]
MGATLDPVRRRRYLEAMGIQVWQRRAGSAAGEGDEVARAAVQAADAPLPGAEASVALSVVPADSPAPTDAMAALGWEDLRAAVAACRACGLCETRTQTVFGVGRRDADLMLIGEAPGAEEDRRGEPFVGRAGQLLDRMLAAIGLSRDQVYIANILKCRPPGNRDPKPEEAAACRAFLLRQIALVQPRVLVSLGRISAQNLLETDEAVGRLRGRWLSFGPRALPLMVTYHPSYLLRSPEQKARAWQDLIQVARRLRGG